MNTSGVFTIDSIIEYYNYLNDYEKADEFYEKVIADNPSNYKLLCGAAEYFYGRGKCEEAIKYADRAISIDCTDRRAYKIKANTYLWNDDRSKAFETVETMLRQGRPDSEAYYVAGDIYYDCEKYETAMEFYEKAIELNPQHIDAIIGKIACLYYSKQYTACLNCALKAEKNFDNKDILRFIADTYTALHDSENADKYYKKALKKDSENKA